jgi:hypothetical protein
MTNIRVQGLVRLMNMARQKLAEGIPPDQVEEFSSTIFNSLEQVETICKKNRMTPNHLPPPSLHAYQYLKSIDLGKLPVTHSPVLQKAKPARISNIISSCSQIQEQMLQLIQPYLVGKDPQAIRKPDPSKIQKSILERIARINKILDKNNQSPSQLPPPSRRAYRWLQFLADPKKIEAHLGTLLLINRVAQDHIASPAIIKRRQSKVTFNIYNLSALYRTRTYPNHKTCTIHEAFVGAPDQVIESLVYLQYRKSNQKLAMVKSYVNSQNFLQLSRMMAESGNANATTLQGTVYNLNRVFERVNMEFFHGRQEIPNLTWSQMATRRKFGHYSPSNDTVMISISLDSIHIPEYVIEFVMYHELLHRKIGVKVSGTRAYGHTSKFRKAERQFPRYLEAQEYLNKLSRSR